MRRPKQANPEPGELSQREVDFLLGSGSPLRPADKADLRARLRDGRVRIAPPRGPARLPRSYWVSLEPPLKHLRD